MCVRLTWLVCTGQLPRAALLPSLPAVTGRDQENPGGGKDCVDGELMVLVQLGRIPLDGVLWRAYYPLPCGNHRFRILTCSTVCIAR